MTRRQPADPAPGPLEEYATRFDDLFVTLAQRDRLSAATSKDCCCPLGETRPSPRWPTPNLFGELSACLSSGASVVALRVELLC
jgi:hypothetical protein